MLYFQFCLVTCEIQQFTCVDVAGLICLDQTLKCDGIRFCPGGGSDEDDCGKSRDRCWRFLCLNQKIEI